MKNKIFLGLVISSLLFVSCKGEQYVQPTIGTVEGTGVTEITVKDYKFRDANKNGELDTYEDWRLTPEERAADLLTRMDVEQKAALLGLKDYIGGPTDSEGTVSDDNKALIVDSHIRYNLTRWGYEGDSAAYARYHNSLQEIAASTPLGIPMVIATDPVHEVSTEADSSAIKGGGSNSSFTLMPKHLGLAAINDVSIAREIGAMHAEEFRSAGARLLLGPMADLASEPLWDRVSHTFGENSATVAEFSKAYIQGLQGEDAAVNPETGIAATIKHFPGAGPNEGGMDSHSFPGRFNSYTGDNLEEHLSIFRTVLEANPAALMPTYSIINTTYKGKKIENVPAAYSKILMQDVLRGELGWDGLVTSDWGTVAGEENQMYKMFGFAMAWGDAWDLTLGERVSEFAAAGSHQIGMGSGDDWMESLDDGEIDETVIDQGAMKALELMFKVGVFENPYSDPAEAVRVAERNTKRGEELMQEAITLLKNDSSILPLDRATADVNGAPGVQVYFAGNSGDEINDYAMVPGFTVVDNISEADYVIKRIAAREGMYFGLDGGVPLSWDGEIFVFDQETKAPGTELSKQQDHPFGFLGSESNTKVWTGIKDDLERTIDQMKPEAKLILSVTMNRPFVITPYLDDVDVLMVDYGATNSALLNIIFQMENMAQNTSVQPKGTLPMSLPKSDDDAYFQDSDIANDYKNITFKLGDGIKKY